MNLQNLQYNATHLLCMHLVLTIGDLRGISLVLSLKSASSEIHPKWPVGTTVAYCVQFQAWVLKASFVCPVIIGMWIKFCVEPLSGTFLDELSAPERGPCLGPLRFFALIKLVSFCQVYFTCFQLGLILGKFIIWNFKGVVILLLPKVVRF